MLTNSVGSGSLGFFDEENYWECFKPLHDENSKTPQKQNVLFKYREVNLLEHITKVNLGNDFIIILSESGCVYVMGNNEMGIHGMGDTEQRSGFTCVPGLTSIKDISAGGQHAMALKEDNTLYIWGSNRFRACGQDSETIVTQAAVINDRGCLQGKPIKQIQAAQLGSIVLTEQGDIYVTGNFNSIKKNTFSQAKLEQNTNVFVSRVFSSSASLHAFCITNDHKIYAWGLNYTGQLCTTDNSIFATVKKPDALQIEDICCGNSFTLFLMKNGSVLASNRLGRSTYIPGEPVKIEALCGGVSQIAAGASFALILKDDGSVYVWGDNDMHQLGTGDANFVDDPVVNDVFSPASSVHAGFHVSLCLHQRRNRSTFRAALRDMWNTMQ